jgi:hypothetical protein
MYSFMNPEHLRVLVARRMQQATEALEDGRYLLAAGHGESRQSCKVRAFRPALVVPAGVLTLPCA